MGYAFAFGLTGLIFLFNGLGGGGSGSSSDRVDTRDLGRPISIEQDLGRPISIEQVDLSTNVALTIDPTILNSMENAGKSASLLEISEPSPSWLIFPLVAGVGALLLKQQGK